MRTVHKYPLYIGRNIELWLPAGAKILCVVMEGQAVSLWAEIEASQPFVRRIFSVFGTGQIMPDNFELTYISTIFDDGFIGHVYEHA